MKLSTDELTELADLAIVAATTAGEMIARSRPQEVDHKSTGASLASQVVTETDRQSEDIILDILRPTLERFELGLLTEEQDDDGSRLTTDYFWCIDPLDGTLPFIEGTPGYSVSIALVERNGTPRVGVVFDPVEETLLHAILASGAFRNGEPWLPEPSTADVFSIYADRSSMERDDHKAAVVAIERFAHGIGLSAVRIDATRGGVLNACGVLGNSPACYFKFPAATGGGHLWDFAASACLFGELGAVATDMFGAPLDLNREDATNMAHRGVLFATDDTLAEQIRATFL